MQPKVKSEEKLNWVIPSLLWVISLSAIAVGFGNDTALVALGLLLSGSAVLATVAAYGSARSQMDPLRSSDEMPEAAPGNGTVREERGHRASSISSRI